VAERCGVRRGVVGLELEWGESAAKQLEAVDTFLKNHHVPSSIGDRVRNYYDYLWQREIHSNDKAIMGGLSAGLRSELVLYIYRSMLDKVSVRVWG